jgi:radical SAM enzyme (TIGR01210 family)
VAFLTNSECPFSCTFCDLWVNTLDGPTPPGAVAGQVERIALDHPAASHPHIKLYNSGNFWDQRAIPAGDMPRVAAALRGRTTVIVESHPKLVDERAPAFNDALGGGLEVAMGLETADPEVLASLNKSMTPADFAVATRRLVAWGIPVRAFILVRPPGQDEEQALHWAKRSIDFAQDAGAQCCVLIPTRGPDPPALETVEASFRHGLARNQGRVFVDLWDLQAPTERLAALDRANRTQHAEMLG